MKKEIGVAQLWTALLLSKREARKVDVNEVGQFRYYGTSDNSLILGFCGLQHSRQIYSRFRTGLQPGVSRFEPHLRDERSGYKEIQKAVK